MAPTIEKVIIDNGGTSQIEGEARPGDVVELVSDGAELGTATVSGNGRWRITLKSGLQAGTYQIRADAREDSTGSRRAGDEIRVSIPAELGGRAVVAYDGITGQDRDTRQRAEKLADAAGRAFDEVTAQRSDGANSSAGPEPESSEPKQDGADTGALSLVVEWLKRSARGYREEVIDRLARTPDAAAATASDNAAEAPAVDPDVAAETIRKERTQAEARRMEMADANAVRSAQSDAKAAADAAQKEAVKRKQAEDLARQKAESDKRIAEELERLKKAREEADRAKAQRKPDAQAAAPASRAAITLERFYLPGEKRPAQDRESGRAETAEATDGAPDTSRPPARCGAGKVFKRNGRRWYRTGPDDTLWDIAEKFYGSGLAYSRIYKINRKRLSSPHVVRPCLALRLPGRA